MTKEIKEPKASGGKINAFYCRSSLKNETLIEESKKLLTDYAKKQGMGKYEFYIDSGFPGTTLNRPELTRLLDNVKAGKIATVTVADDGQLTIGSSEQLADLVKVFEENGVEYTALKKSMFIW